MDERRKQAYAFLLSAALLHMRYDLAAFWSGLSIFHPWRLFHESNQVRRASHRAFAFHNLAIILTHDLANFDEERFWNDIEQFKMRFPEDWADYRAMFDRKLAGEEVLVLEYGRLS
jgi:hypothetical protein